MSPKAPILLLAISAFFHFVHGGMIQCRNCPPVVPSVPCDADAVCEVDSEIGSCGFIRLYKRGYLSNTWTTCFPKKGMCGASREHPEDDIRFEAECCDDRDLCNDG